MRSSQHQFRVDPSPPYFPTKKLVDFVSTTPHDDVACKWLFSPTFEDLPRFWNGSTPPPRECSSLPMTLMASNGDHMFSHIMHLHDTLYGSVSLFEMSCGDGPSALVALKRFNKHLLRHRNGVAEDPFKELSIQKRLTANGTSHGNVLPLFGVLESADDFYAVLPFVECDLFDFFIHHGRELIPTGQEEDCVRRVFRGMLEAVLYCHLEGVCHLDLSFENFLIFDLSALLIDFGLSERSDEEGYISHPGRVGKLAYMAPELWTMDIATRINGSKADVFSLGVCLVIMLSGLRVWDQPSFLDKHFVSSVVEKKLGENLRAWGFSLSPLASEFMLTMLCVDPDKRISVAQALDHPWMTCCG